MLKKYITAAVCAACIAAGGAAYADTDSWNDDNIMPLLDSLGIMQGDGSGSYGLDRTVSRAEMAKITVNSSSYKDETALGMSVSPFSDVPSYSWAAPYILNGSSNGLFKGFVDGSFHPDDTVSFEEAVTMMLRVLGYEDSRFGASYPHGQVNLAKNIGLLDNVDSDYGAALTRRQVARLVYNALNTERSDSNSKLISVFDAEIIEDVVITEVPSGSGGKVTTTSGKYNAYDGFSSDYLGLSGDIAVINSKDLLSFVPEDSRSEKYVIYSVLDDTVIGYRNGLMSEIELKDDTVCYKENTKSTYSALRNGMEMGDVISVKYNADGDIDYCIYSTGSLKGPVKYVSGTGFATNSDTRYMRDGNEVTSSGLKTNDIIYYSDELNIVMAYSTKVSGVYQSASPSRDNPKTVTVSGKEYTVEGVEAYNDLSSSGPFKYGDTITVCLGKDGKTVAGVVTSSAASTDVHYGYVLETGKKSFSNNDSTDYSSYYVRIAAPDGDEYEYPVKNNPSDYMGRVVKLTTTSSGTGIASVQSGGITGVVDADNLKIGSYDVSEDCKIIDTGGTISSDEPVYKRLYLQRLDGMNLSNGKVSYVHKNSSGEIDELILSTATGDIYSYGIITSSASGTAGTRTVKVDVGGSVQNASIAISGAGNGSPCKIRSYNGKFTVVSGLKSYSGTGKNLTQTTIDIDGETYKLSDEVAVYKETGVLSYSKISINEAIEGNYTLTAYYDSEESAGGRIRIIIAREK
ncbi:MAG: S-layer homology domain-containing protein [bacterium]|nr:S-layer homology domain-containing protein [bacterium]